MLTATNNNNKLLESGMANKMISAVKLEEVQTSLNIDTRTVGEKLGQAAMISAA